MQFLDFFMTVSSVNMSQWLIDNASLVWIIPLLPGLYQVSKLLINILGFEIIISGDDDNARYLLTWLRDYFNDRSFTSQIAQTVTLSPLESRANCWQDKVTNLWRFDSTTGDRKTCFEVGYGKHFFFYKGWLYLFERTRIQRDTVSRNEETLSLRCLLSSTTKPAQYLIREAKMNFLAKEIPTISIFVPVTKTERGKGGQSWTCLLDSKTARDLDTVELDSRIKEDFLADLNTFLAPEQAAIYQRKGIPYRRGYLLQGPPGTGKTSLVHAVAGKFHLNVYTISLSSPNISDEDLLQLFSKLPARCVVLFEDIDQAGLPNRGSSTQRTSSNDPPISVPITLSGFLNAIGGITTPEGPCFIYSTNKPENLDPALLRPGRIDKTFQFELASRPQIKSMFNRMFDLVAKDDESKGKRFASMIPERSKSTAAIEGFLLEHQNDPDEAIAFWEEKEMGRITPEDTTPQMGWRERSRTL